MYNKLVLPPCSCTLIAYYASVRLKEGRLKEDDTARVVDLHSQGEFVKHCLRVGRLLNELKLAAQSPATTRSLGAGGSQ